MTEFDDEKNGDEIPSGKNPPASTGGDRLLMLACGALLITCAGFAAVSVLDRMAIKRATADNRHMLNELLTLTERADGHAEPAPAAPVAPDLAEQHAAAAAMNGHRAEAPAPPARVPDVHEDEDEGADGDRDDAAGSASDA